MALGNKARRECQNIPNGGHWKHLLVCHGIGALVKNNNVAVTDKEGPRCHKIAKLEVSEWIIIELVLLGGFGVKRGHLEDKRDAFRVAHGGKS